MKWQTPHAIELRRYCQGQGRWYAPLARAQKPNPVTNLRRQAELSNKPARQRPLDSARWTGPAGLGPLDWARWTGPAGLGPLDWARWTGPAGQRPLARQLGAPAAWEADQNGGSSHVHFFTSLDGSGR
jgi:hypothetical protein